MILTTARDTAIYDGPPGPSQRKKGTVFGGFKMSVNPAPGLKNWYVDSNGDYYDAADFPLFASQPVSGGGPAASSIGWADAKFKIPELWKYSRGDKIKIAVLDTGINPSHPCFADKRTPVIYRRFFDDGSDSNMSDLDDHGTGVASIIGGEGGGFYGIAYEATLIVAKVDWYRSINDVYKRAMLWALEAGAQIINISEDIRSCDSGFQAIIDDAAKRGVFIVAAAGNTGIIGSQYTAYPACYENVLSIGSIDDSGMLEITSPSSPMLDLVAPGVRISMASSSGGERIQSGTSFSAPFVSASLALMLGKLGGQSSANLRQKIEDALLTTATEVTGADKTRQGKGCIDPISAFAKVFS